jgi:ABC-type nitrate/sulfonate/bicarbonate transport system ATPase subunit
MTVHLSDTSVTPLSTSRTPKLEIRGLNRRFNVNGQPFTALSDIHLSIAPGEFVSIVGSSGCGKSTLLRAIVGLDTDYSGDIFSEGKRVREPSLDRAIVFQEHRLLPWLTARQNVELGLLKANLPKAEKNRLIDAHLNLVRLSDFAQAFPGQLSGGMSQRVAIARALVNNPGLLLLDEPLGALDALTRSHLQDELRRIVREEGVTAVLVTHDVEEAVYLGDRVVIMKPNPGHISEIVDIPLGANRNRQSAEFARSRDYVLDRLHDRPHHAQPYTEQERLIA